jgi:hypothetical protein
MFYLDATTKTIKSQQYKDKSWDIANVGKSRNMQIWKTNSRWFQLFKFKGGKIVNERGLVVGATGDNLVVVADTNSKTVQWKIIYVDTARHYIKGEFHPRFGLYVQRYFYIISSLRSGRYLDIIGRDVVIKTPNGRKTQVWYFDAKSETIRSKSNNQTLEIANSGRTNRLQIWKTNRGWW